MTTYLVRYLYEGTERTERLRADHHAVDEAGTHRFYDSLDGLLMEIHSELVTQIEEIKP